MMIRNLSLAVSALILSTFASSAWAQFDPAPPENNSVPAKLSLEVTQDDLKKLREAKESKNEEAMIGAVSRILGKDPKNLQALNSLAVYYFESNKPGLSKIILSRALADHPNVPALHNNMGVIFLQEGKQRQAIASFRKSLELRGNYQTGAANIASIYLEYMDYSRALGPLEDAYKSTRSGLDKGEAIAIEFANNYAVALTGLGEFAKAEKVYQSALEKNSKHPVLMLNYAILLVERLNKPKEALGVISKLKFAADDRATLQRVEELEKKASVKE